MNFVAPGCDAHSAPELCGGGLGSGTLEHRGVAGCPWEKIKLHNIGR